MRKLNVFAIAAGVITLTAVPVSLEWSKNAVSISIDRAEARIGRPATALSVAGVHRRAYRRAYRGGVYGGLAGAGAYGISAYSGYRYPAYNYGYANSYWNDDVPTYGSYANYGYPGFGFSSYGYSGYGYPSYGYSGYGYGASYGYPSYSYAGYGYPRYAYPGYRAARRVAIHRARWH
ncbi:hypothetical protein [Pseudorhodoplanes sp.]|uniref:hypothetical protein n=1 Tax=Pseudorhodoplanes sp. TaxID=1934341 RepID=UPI002C3B7846|nr:hypothetical protein [Pseudorhodoplanes sp.]HWV55674.1 hypothetical protein [Pseudorhodoplanes sp.]